MNDKKLQLPAQLIPRIGRNCFFLEFIGSSRGARRVDCITTTRLLCPIKRGIYGDFLKSLKLKKKN